MNPESIVITVAQQMLRLRSPHGPYEREQIVATVDEMLSKFASLGLDEASRDRIILELETRLAISIGTATKLVDPHGHQDWYSGDRKQGRRFFERYRAFLSQDIGWAGAAIDALDDATDLIMELLEDPQREGPWDRRGLVVGHVQSGKTANYAGVICKAADAGYKLVIVLSGMHNLLRKQTQKRLERDFLGYDTSNAKRGQPLVPFGVGDIDRSVHAEYLTTQLYDFKRSIADNVGVGVQERPLLLVIKKNASILRNVNAWVAEILVKTGDTATRPLIVIDDEADQASIDIGDPELDDQGVPAEDYDPSRINGEIRKLLRAFDRSAYIGYTATPFANILIHDEAIAKKYGDDLFPRSFIINLPAPSDYVGPRLVFGIGTPEPGEEPDDPLPVVRDVDQKGEDWISVIHKKEFRPSHAGKEAIPPSLETAILSFIIVCAARASRGQVAVHNSMLLHVTRFKQVHQRIFEQVEEWLNDVKRRLRYGVEDGPLVEELHRLWVEDFEPTTRAICSRDIGKGLRATTWKQVQGHLVTAVDKIRVQIANSAAPDAIDYDGNSETGLSIIAIGGDKLSRGLTLEGLSVSYFLRPSKMYDTLMQMGRWFGYRPGYVDLCRLFLPEELSSWFQHVTKAAEELRDRFDTMARLGATPENYGHRIQSHEILLVTALNKMRYAKEFQVSFAGESKIQTVFFTEEIRNRRNAIRYVGFLKTLGSPYAGLWSQQRSGKTRKWENTRVWEGVSGAIVATFVQNIEFPEEARDVNAPRLAAFIQAQLKINELTNWTVALMSGNAEEISFDGMAFITNARKRIQSSRADGRFAVKTVLSPQDEALDLDEEAYERALDLTNKVRSDEGKAPLDIPAPPFIRHERGRTPERALLLIYPISPKSVDVGVDFPIFSIVISFPDSENAVPVRYRYNTVMDRLEQI